MPTSSFAQTVAYLYFMRFGIFIWLSMLGFISLDLTPASTATRGILTLAFEIVIAGWVALLSSRVVCAYGEERFGVAVPRWFCVRQEMGWPIFLGAQAPGLALLGYVLDRSLTDGQQPPVASVASMAGGIVLAVVCWYALASFYYWTYETDQQLVAAGRMTNQEAQVRQQSRVGSNPNLSAKAFVAPVGQLQYFSYLEGLEPPALSRIFESLFALVARNFKAGFCKGTPDPSKKAALNSGHQLALITLAFFLFVYIALCHYAAPVAMPIFKNVVRFGTIGVLFLWIALAVRHWHRTSAGLKTEFRWLCCNFWLRQRNPQRSRCPDFMSTGS